MATVDVSVGGRRYQLACENGQERHLQALAAVVDLEATALARSMGAVGEARLLLMAALMIADKLNDASAAREQAGAGVAPAEAAALADAVGRLDALLAAHDPRR